MILKIVVESFDSILKYKDSNHTSVGERDTKQKKIHNSTKFPGVAVVSYFGVVQYRLSNLVTQNGASLFTRNTFCFNDILFFYSSYW